MTTVARAADGSSFRSTEKKDPPSCAGDALGMRWDSLGMRAAMTSHDDRVIYDARSVANSEGAEEAERLTNGSEHMLDRGYFHMRK